jgi:hypothetical protein
MPGFDGKLMATFPICSHIWKPCLAEAGYLGNHGKAGEMKGGKQISPGASRVCQADFFTCGANSMIFPRCSGETHFTLFRKLFGM